MSSTCSTYPRYTPGADLFYINIIKTQDKNSDLFKQFTESEYDDNGKIRRDFNPKNAICWNIGTI